jgi:nucleotide-binding universal stress UspA family protein
MSGCIVCGVDGSLESGRAAGVAARLARDLGSNAVLVHVEEKVRTHSLSLGGLHPGRRWRTRRLLRATAAECCFPSHTRVRLKTGDPTTELLATAREEDAELLVVSTGGLDTASPALLGGTASALMRRSPCPVVVVPTRCVTPLDAEGMRDVVCALQGRAGDAAVLGLAADLAARLGGELHAISRGHDPIDAAGFGIEAEAHAAGSLPMEDAIRRVVDEARAGLAVVGPPDSSQPASGLDIPVAVALAADGDTPVVVLADAAELQLGSGHYELADRVA